ncbi:hypothetical protein [Nibricoccus sp. IMCC34717]|uniref:hypothetical protein n=1 Tax=Nibricoccus sp. IMCC34717 TaxID=3034021 RepID=UPI00384CCAF0
MIPQILSFFQERQVPVEFRTFPGHPIDTSLFDPVLHNRITRDGFFKCSPAELLQAAAIHFQGRYRTSRPLQWLNACHEVLPSLLLGTTRSRHLCLNSNESSEFQAKSTEVLAVGLGLALSRTLFRIKYRDISTIERTGKRCDFAFQKNAISYVLETRGRKRDGQIESAIEDIFEKKTHHSGAKYGFVSHLPRGGEASSVIVIDPPTDALPLEEWDRFARLLRYYSSASRLSGFWRLSNLLNERADALTETRDLARFDERPLEFGNIEKFGHALEVSSRGTSAYFFVPRSQGAEGLFNYESYAFVFGLSPDLFQALEAQDFSRLMDLRPQTGPLLLDGIAANANDDGTILAALPVQQLREIVSR